MNTVTVTGRLQADPVTTLSLAARHPTPNAPFTPARGAPAHAGRHPTPGAPFAPLPAPHAATGGPETLIGPFLPMPDAGLPDSGAPTLLGPGSMGCPPVPGIAMPGTEALAAGSVASGPAGSPLAAGSAGSGLPAPLQGDGPTLPTVPNGMMSILPTQPASPPPVIGPRAMGSPFPGASVTVSPWQAGQPGGPPTERNRRSWAVIDLPALDPEVLARHRRIVLRAAAALLAVIVLLAILAGHC